jgi:hypothetical protein
MTRRYLVPQTDVPAAEDWSTDMILTETRSMARAGWIGLAVLVPAIVCTAVLLPFNAGNVIALILLGVLFLGAAMGPIVHRMESAPLRRGLLKNPWRRCAATVAVTDDVFEVYQHLMVFDPSGAFVVRGMLEDMADLVLDQQEVFLVGPDDDGRVVLRVAGLCKMFQARVDDKAEVRPREREPHVPGRPLDDPAVAQAFRGFRWGTRAWLWSGIPSLLGATLVLLSIWPIALAGLVIGGLFVVFGLLSLPMLQLGPYYRQAVAEMEAATQWTAMPFTLFPWEPGREVAGLAQLPGGKMALVQFPLPDSDVIANVADTGTLWVAGSPTSEAVAAGVPRVPALTIAIVQPDRDRPEEKTQPWLLRGSDPTLSTIPTLTR